jgi:hypothetical protein
VTFGAVVTIGGVFTGSIANPFSARCRHDESEMAMVCVSVLLLTDGSDKAEMRMEMRTCGVVEGNTDLKRELTATSSLSLSSVSHSSHQFHHFESGVHQDQ